jgi:hypothetical protein
MLNRLVLLSMLLFFLSPLKAQFDTSYVKTRLLNNADSLAYAFKTRNWDIYTRYTNPSMIGALGGKQAFISYISDMFGTVPVSAWKKYQPGRVLQVIRAGKDLQAVIELHSVIEWQGMRATTTDYLVAESWTEGYTWTFFDSQGDPKASKIILPTLSEQLIIPAKIEKVEPLEEQNRPPLKPKTGQ